MKKLLALLLALALCFSLAACGGGLTNEPATPAEQPAPAETPADTPAEKPSDTPAEQPAEAGDGYAPFVPVQGVDDSTILVGNTAATTGAFATVGIPFNAGMEAAFKAYNDAGGFDGRAIKLIHYDDGFDAAQGLTYTQTLVETDHVFAIVGHFGTNTVGATLDYLKQMGIPMVYAATGIADLYQEGATGNNKVIYPVQPIYNSEGRVLLARALAPVDGGMGLGGTKIGVISTTDDAGTGLLYGVKKQNETLNADIVYQEVDAAATDYAAAVNVLKDNGCDVVIPCMNQAPLAILMSSMRDANFNANVVTSYVNASAVTLGAFVENGSVTADRRVFSTAWLDTSTEEGMAGYLEFYAAMAAWELENGGSGNDNALNSYAMAGYIAGSLFVQALNDLHEKGLELNWANFNDVMESVDFMIPMGGEISFHNGDRLAITSLALNTISLEVGESGYYELQVVSPIMSLDDVLASIK
jgi:ABC-type branched-subunit amino acid transport system substrate-binding protein